MAPTLVPSIPPPNDKQWNDADWIYEPKIDGYRVFILIKDGAVQILSRKNNDLTRAYPTVVAAAACVNARAAMIDGELAALDSTGHVSFQALQRRGAVRNTTIRFYGFDLIIRNGKDLKSLPIEERREQLEQVTGDSGLHMTVELPGAATDMMARAEQFGFEGIVAKRRGSPYQPPARTDERSPDWLKWKAVQQQEFVIGGFQPDGATIYELIVGYYDDSQQLHFASRVKDGFVPHVRKALYRVLQPLVAAECPFVDLPTSDRESSHWGGGVSAADVRKLRWVTPELVVQIQFSEWTHGGRLRHSSYVALREDKSAADVRRE